MDYQTKGARRYVFQVTHQKEGEARAKRYWPLGMSAALLLLLLGAWAAAPADEWIQAIGRTVAQLGWAAPVAYVALYVVGTVVLAPSPLMSIAAGVASGGWGFPLAVVAATAGATVSFLIGRYFLNAISRIG